MTEPIDPHLQRSVEVRLRQRLDALEESLDSSGEGGAVLERGAAIAQWVEMLDRHAERVLADCVAFGCESSDPAASQWLRQRYERHLEQVAGRLAGRLGKSSGGFPPPSAIRNRFVNLLAEIKARSAEEFARVLQRGNSGGRTESAEAQAEELDDRLPLRRRRSFDRDLTGMAGECASGKSCAGMVMIDLDHFKNVNDQHGHPVGDEVLLAVSRIIVKRLGLKGKAYRYGGEEIALLLPGYSWEEAWGLGERIRKDIEAQPLSSKNLRITASLGVASIPDDAADGPTLLERADTALYRAKQEGRNRVCAASECIEAAARNQQRSKRS